MGAVLYGETSDGPWYFDMMRDGARAGDIRDRLIFGRDYKDVAPLEAYGGRCSVAG